MLSTYFAPEVPYSRFLRVVVVASVAVAVAVAIVVAIVIPVVVVVVVVRWFCQCCGELSVLFDQLCDLFLLLFDNCQQILICCRHLLYVLFVGGCGNCNFT